MKWLYESVERVPTISDEQIAKMRHIHPLLKVPESVMYRRIRGTESLHSRDVSILWDAEPEGAEFTFDTLNATTIITQHHSSVFFKPSLAEVYAWILVYMPQTWEQVRFFCLGDYRRVGSSCDFSCDCLVLGGDMLFQGPAVRFANGAIGHELVKILDTQKK